MTCREFERVLPEIIDGGRTIEQNEHLGSCPVCWELVIDLNSISSQARQLRTEEVEPNPRVWNFIEIALRHEGLIREAQPVLIPIKVSPRPWWRSPWLLPTAAMLLVGFGILQYGEKPLNRTENINAKDTPVVTNLPFENLAEKEDRQLLYSVQRQSPAMLASYQASLQNVNAYIRDAEESAKNNPNDEAAQRILMNAYEQKSMVYEMALDRSLP
jgi:hypothetical protein